VDLPEFETSHVLKAWRGPCPHALWGQSSLAERTQLPLYFGAGLDGFQQARVIGGQGGGSTEEKEGQLSVSWAIQGNQA